MKKHLILFSCLCALAVPACRQPEAGRTRFVQNDDYPPPQASPVLLSFKPAWLPTPDQIETPLLPNQPPQDAWLEAGQARRYHISVHAGQFVRVDVLQCGLDVELFLHDDLGKAMHFDRPTGRYDSEWVSYLAEADRELVLTVYASRAGYYTIGFRDWRPAREGDRPLVEAEEAFVKAFHLVLKGAVDEGMRLYEEISAFFKDSEQTYSTALLQYAKGGAYRNLGNKEEALRYYRQAAQLFRAQESVLRGVVLNNQGFLHHRSAETDQAFLAYFQALQVFRKHGNIIQEGRTLLNIGMLCQDLGHFQLAMDFTYDALECLAGSGVPWEQTAINNLGVLYEALGELKKALDHHLRALASGRYEDMQTRTKMTMNVGALYQRLGDRENAQHMYDLALELAEEYELETNKQEIFQIIGEFYLDANNVKKALAFLKLVENQNSGQIQFSYGRALVQTWQASGNIQDLEKAVQHFEAALAWSRGRNDPRLEINCLFFLAQTYDRLGKNKPIALIDRAIEMVESQREEVVDANLRNAFFASNQNLSDLKISILMNRHSSEPKAGHQNAALHQFEKATARHLLDVLAAETGGSNDYSHYLLFNKYWEARLEQAQDLESAEGNTAQQLELAIMEKTMARSRSSAEISSANILQVNQIQDEMPDSRTLILEYHLGEKTSYLWAVSKDGVQAFDLPPRAQLEAEISQAVGAIRKVNDSDEVRKKQEKAMKSLSKNLLAPLSLENINRVAIVANGSLQQLPFGALPVTNSSGEKLLLIDMVEVVYLPSASVLAAMRKEHEGRKPPKKLLLAFADPIFSTEQQPVQISLRSAEKKGKTDWAPLPLTGFEARRIVARALESNEKKTSRIISGFEATRAAVLSPEPEQYRILHFATHGYVDSQNPSRSSLIFSLYDRNRKPRNGYLTLQDITWLKLNADLVVLSACDTALGKEVRGEGLISLARGFMVAGAPRVVATLWQVADDTTAVLMDHFYEKMFVDNLSPAASLRSAQLAMKERFPDRPYYWAGFVLIGDWQ